jgi:hypothetical protein
MNMDDIRGKAGHGSTDGLPHGDESQWKGRTRSPRAFQIRYRAGTVEHVLHPIRSISETLNCDFVQDFLPSQPRRMRDESDDLETFSFHEVAVEVVDE